MPRRRLDLTPTPRSPVQGIGPTPQPFLPSALCVAQLPPTKMGTKMSYEREFDDNDDDRWMAVAEEEPWVVDLVAQQPLADDRDHGVDECDKAASSKAHADDEMALAFERYDSDHSGTMSLHELTQMLKSFGCSREVRFAASAAAVYRNTKWARSKFPKRVMLVLVPLISRGFGGGAGDSRYYRSI